MENVILNVAELSNTDIHFITDLSLVEMNNIPKRLGEENFPVFLYKLKDLVEMHRRSPQEKCPMVSAGHGAGHGDDDGEGHGDDHGDGHGDGHGDSHGDDHGYDHPKEMRVEDLQTDDQNYYTIAKDNPNSFARPSKYCFVPIFKDIRSISMVSKPFLLPSSALVGKLI